MTLGVEKHMKQIENNSEQYWLPQSFLLPVGTIGVLVLAILLWSGSISTLTTWLLLGIACLWIVIYLLSQKTRRATQLSQKFQQEIHKLEQTLGAIADTHWDWDLKSDAYDYHGSLASVLGYSEHPGDTAFWKEVIHPVDRPMHKYRLLRHLENEAVPFYSEYRLKNHDGHYRWFAARGQVVQRDSTGQATLMVGGLENIQQRKDLEKNLIHAHKMEAVGQLTGGIAHDFNNILASVLGYTELAQDTRNPTKISSYLEQIHQGGLRARNVVKQLLDFSRGARSETEIVNLEDELYNAIMMLRSTLPTSIEIIEDYASEACYTRLDPDQFQRVMLNLCINARDAMNGNGTLSIKLEKNFIREEQCVSCKGTIKGAYHSITVSDNGEGIPPENLERLFDPFYTTKEVGKGSGLGLSVVHGITHEFSGHLGINSNPGTGTRVSLYLPVLSKEIAESKTRTLKSPAVDLKLRVLVVDDETSIASLISEVLKNNGADVELTTSAPQALNRLKQVESGSENDKFDLVISDQVMPTMTGLELATHLMTINPELPVLLCSGSEIQQSNCPTNVVKVLQKPINNQYLLDSISSIFA